MKQEDDRLPEALRVAARDYNEPPELSHSDLDDMWSAIEKDAFPKRFSSPSAPRAESREPRAQSRFSTRNLLPLAAVLLLGVAIGRFGLPRKQQALPSVAVRPAGGDSVAVPEPYQTTTSQYLGRTAALLVSLPSEVHSGRADDLLLGRAHDLLLTTRLLLDSPAASDPRFRNLLEDLELVLAQVVRLQADQGKGELDLIRQALDQRDVLPRLRSAVADISADD
ncbi:MAG TPA: hypothetical protein VIF32_12635 [Gemmatimonadaceae bacterium]